MGLGCSGRGPLSFTSECLSVYRGFAEQTMIVIMIHAISLLGVGLLLSQVVPLRAETDIGRYLVELAGQPAISAVHRAEVKCSQQAVRDALAQRNLTVLRSIDL